MHETMRTFISDNLKSGAIICEERGRVYSVENSFQCILGADWVDHYARLLTCTYRKVLELSGSLPDNLEDLQRECEDHHNSNIITKVPTEQTWRSAVYADAEEIFWLTEGLAVEKYVLLFFNF
jgi:hypothetical protein